MCSAGSCGPSKVPQSWWLHSTPDLFLHAAESMGVGPGDCLVIEDTSTGVRGARAAGMRVLGYTPTVGAQALLNAGAHGVFDDMAHCPPLAWPRTG